MSQTPTPAQLQALLQYVGKKFGVSPDQLLHAVQGGGLEGLSRQLSPENAAKLQQLTGGNTKKAEELLRSPAAQKLLEQVLKQNP